MDLMARCSDSDFLRQLARLAANYGDSRIASTEQRTMLLREWVEAFRYHAPSHLHGAVSAAIRSCKFWPTIAEISAEITKLRREAVEAIHHLEAKKRGSRPEEPFARDGRTEAEEVAHRAAQILKWKEQFREPQPTR
jgi:hypothetical protein